MEVTKSSEALVLSYKQNATFAEGLAVIPERRKNSLNLSVNIFRREIYCEPGNISERV